MCNLRERHMAAIDTGLLYQEYFGYHMPHICGAASTLAPLSSWIPACLPGSSDQQLSHLLPSIFLCVPAQLQVAFKQLDFTSNLTGHSATVPLQKEP